MILAYMVLFLFTKPAAPFPKQRAAIKLALLRHSTVPLDTVPADQLTPRKRQRNLVYWWRGGIMIACLVLLVARLIPGFPQLAPRIRCSGWNP